MPVEINIIDKDIVYAENVLLADGQHFDVERKDFIKNIDTIDLQAVPGSGKTTALLAKLLILEKYLPFDNGSGILVISHTNAAIDEIKNKIGKFCPKLFSYPNFIGTIQSFVDEFLALPYYTILFNCKPYRIDDEIYNEKIEKYLSKIWFHKYGFSQDIMHKISYIKNSNESLFYNFRFELNKDKKIILVKSLSGEKLEIKKPKGKTKEVNYSDYSDSEKRELYDWFTKFKEQLLKNEHVLHFDDAYFLANSYLNKFPLINKLLRQRFRYIFVDEMQDMDKHQYDLLEKIFFDGGSSISKYQRIGDKNQSIFNGSAKLDDIWNDRDKVLELKGSYRLTKEVANIVKHFGLDFIDIDGRFSNYKGSNIKPHLIVFDNPKNVLPKFTELIKENKLCDEKYPFCSIGWSADYKYLDKAKTNPDKSKFTIKCYHPDFEKDEHRPKEDYSYLESYLLHYDKNKKTLESVRKSILNALLKIVRYENILDDNGRNYTKKKLLSFLKVNNKEQYEKLKLLLYQWSINIIRGKKSEVYSEFKDYISEFLSIFGKSIDKSKDFIKTPANNEHVTSEPVKLKNSNIYEKDGIKIKVTTIHAVKGQTHTATLYMETYYHQDGKGENAKSYESQRLIEQFKGKKIENVMKNRARQSAKMAYVGLSRPTHLLCMAIHNDRFNEADFKDKWKIINITGNFFTVVH